MWFSRGVWTAAFGAVLVGAIFATSAYGDKVLLNPTHDTFIDQFNPNAVNGSSDLVIVRGWPNLELDALVKFDLSSIPPGSVINAAKLKLYYYWWNDADPMEKPLNAHEITSAWSEGTATWNTQPTYNPTAAAAATVPVQKGAWIEWDVTISVRKMLNGTIINHGWEIRKPSGVDNAMIYFHSKECDCYKPVLEIDIDGFEARVLISDATGAWYYPRVAVHGNSIHAVWRDLGASLVKYRRSTDGGTTWQPILTLAISAPVYEPCVAVSGQFVHVVWEGSSNTITYCRSTDNGATFASAVSLSSGTDDGYACDVASYASNVYVVWIQQSPSYDVLLRRSTDNGANWIATTNITADAGTIVEDRPAVAAYASYAYVVWYDQTPTNSYARFKRSTNLGANWSATTTLWTSTLGAFSEVSVAAYWTNVYAVRDGEEGAPAQGPAQRVSTDGGATFASSIYIGDGNGTSSGDWPPEIDAGSYYVSSGATSYINNNNLYVSAGPSGGDQSLGAVGGSSASADISVDGSGSMHVVCSLLDANYKVYYYRHRGLPCDCKLGDANGDATVDISDAVYLIAYIFAQGAAPTPYAICSGDANCDCAVDISDAVYLIAYIFAGGPAPCNCDQWLIKCGPPLRQL